MFLLSTDDQLFNMSVPRGSDISRQMAGPQLYKLYLTVNHSKPQAIS